MKRTAIYAGSFDPITNGHLDIIERAANMFDSLTVGIAVNSSKTPFFTLDERKRMLTSTVSKRLLGGLEQLLILNMKFRWRR